MGLHLQHGREHRGRRGTECSVDGLCLDTVSEVRAVVAGMAGYDCRVDYSGHESGNLGFPAVAADG